MGITIEELIAYDEQEDPIEDEIYSIFYKYKTVLEKSIGHPIKFCISFTDECIYVDWEDSWQYGGYNDGTLPIPFTALKDSGESWIQGIIDEEKLKLLKVEEVKKISDLEKLDELKLKYEVKSG